MQIKWVHKGEIYSLRLGNFEMGHVVETSKGFMAYILDKYEEKGVFKKTLRDARKFVYSQALDILSNALMNLGSLKWRVIEQGVGLYIAPEHKKMEIKVIKGKSKYVGYDYEENELCHGGKDHCKSQLLFEIGKRLKSALYDII